MNEIEPLLVINNSIIYRFLLPIMPFGAVFTLLSAVVLDCRIIVDVLIGISMGILISEMIYYLFKYQLFFFEDQLIITKGRKTQKLIKFNEIISVEYNVNNILSPGTADGPITRYFTLKFKDGGNYLLQFEKLSFDSEMKKALKIFSDANIRIDAPSHK